MINLDKISISSEATLLEALKKMDSAKTKLLIILDNDYYVNLISIGDIQRSIIQNIPLESKVSEIDIDKKIVCNTEDDISRIKSIMLDIRADFMPIIDNGHVVNVFFREDLFDKGVKFNDARNLNLPVVIMAGGKGSRLKPISNIIPKPLIPIGDKTIIENIMDRFIDSGCNNFYLSVNYKKELIQHYFKTSTNHKYQIKYFIEDKPLGTAGSLHLLKGKIDQTFFVTNCDIIIDQDFYDIYDYHRKRKNEITLVAALKHYKIPYGTLESSFGGSLETMNEKPEITFKINAGLYILEHHLLQEIPMDVPFHITDLIIKVKERGGRVGVFPVSEGAWIDIGEWPEYIRNARRFSKNDDHFIGL